MNREQHLIEIKIFCIFCHI